MKITDILTEEDNEYIPRNRSTAGTIGRQLLKKADGDLDTARDMANRFLKQVISAIEEEGRFSKRGAGGSHKTQKTRKPHRSAAGYDQRQTTQSGSVDNFA